MKDRMKMMILILIIIISLVIVYWITNANSKKSDIKQEQNVDSLIFGLATGVGGLGDKAFNDMQFNGMLLAKRQYNIKFIYDSPISADDDFNVIERLIHRDANVIIAGGGFHTIDPVDSLARLYPKVKFIILDDTAKHYYPNVASLAFKQNEGSFLVGSLCAMESKSKKIAMLGAADIDVINDFFIGFRAGAEYIDPSVKILVRYIGEYNDTISPFANPQEANKIANQLYQRDRVDIIYQVAAGSGMGVFNAAKQNKKFAIGVDSDQDYLAEGLILTSMQKRIDVGINMIIGEIIDNKFENKAYKFGLKENGVTLSEMKFTKHLIAPESLERLIQIEADIVNGKIIVPSQYP